MLMVEADPVMQRHLGSLLSAWGYEAVLTSTVEESLAALAHNDFVFSLLDLNLDGADGTELLRRLKIQGGSPGPIILLANGGSSHGNKEQRAYSTMEIHISVVKDCPISLASACHTRAYCDHR